MFDHVLIALAENSNRKYVMSEVCFIKPWFESLSDINKTVFKEFVKNG
jgi:hypothetical protein